MTKATNKAIMSVYEVADLLGVRYYRIAYGERIGGLPPPQRVGEKRVYSAEDVERIRRYFTERAERSLPKRNELDRG
jgi:DNA-binding transcriptional MerR regulator